MSVASRTKELRKALGLTQQEFADRLGITRAAVSKYDIDATDPSDAVISLICREFIVLHNIHVVNIKKRAGNNPRSLFYVDIVYIM